METVGHLLAARSISPSQCPVDLAVEAEDAAGARIGDETHVASLAGLEAHRGPRRNIEPEAARLLAVEGERTVGLVEVIMRADLDRPVAGIGDGDRDRGTAGVELDLAGGDDDLSGDHRATGSAGGR